MADQWYYWRDSDVLGPFSGRQLADLAAAGTLLPSDTVWKGEDEQGFPARRIQNLFPPATPTPDAGGVPKPAGTAPEAAPAPPAAAPVEPPPAPRWDAGRQANAGRARAVAGKGAVLVGQDGTTVKFRKKCTTCGYEDSSWKTIPIPRGSVRVVFYCPKCRKQRQVEIHGQMG
jgi:hypothetical protein